jgi:hypothetical protein
MAEREFCIPDDVRSYISRHMRDDAANHRSMTTPEYRESHKVMWDVIDWEKWCEVMNVQAEYSEISANLVDAITGCGGK